MPEFAPLAFHAYDFSRPELAADLTAAPPYDVISQADREELAARSPYNVIHIDSPASYAASAELLAAWRAQGVIAPLPAGAFYLLASDFIVDEETYRRYGLFGGLELGDWGAKGVFPHEKTYPKAKKDRLELMRATSAQLSPILAVYDDPASRLEVIARSVTDGPEAAKPLVRFTQDDGVTHGLWRLPERFTAELAEIVRSRNVYVADGHHRYETALAYMKERGAEPGAPWTKVFACLSDVSSSGVTILPYHRKLSFKTRRNWDEVLEQAKAFFNVRRLDNLDGFFGMPYSPACVLALPGALHLLEPTCDLSSADAEEKLYSRIGAYVLDRDFFRATLGLTDEELASGEHLSYTPFHAQALKSVRNHEAQAALLTRAVPMELLREVSERGLTMPRKSTYFHPKLPTGLLFSLFERP